MSQPFVSTATPRRGPRHLTDGHSHAERVRGQGPHVASAVDRLARTVGGTENAD